MFKPRGVYSAMMTPFQADGTINEGEIRRMVDFMLAKGLHGIFPVSTVGEFAHMTLEEIYKLMEIVVDQVQGRVPVTPGAGSTCAQNSIKIAKRAKELGCAGVVVCPPYYYSIHEENLQKHYEVIADAVDIPIILYNIPLFCAPISRKVIANLSRHPNIVAMKDSSGSMVDLMHYLNEAQLSQADYTVLVGREDMLAPALMVGANGCMVAAAGIVPEILVGIWNAFQAGNWEKMLRFQNALLPLIRLMFEIPFPVGFKAALALRGFDMGPLKQPLSAAQSTKVIAVTAQLETVLQELIAFIAAEGLATEAVC
jgi:4-hydroxy-tetrahydrodipicolinate synthase